MCILSKRKREFWRSCGRLKLSRLPQRVLQSGPEDAMELHGAPWEAYGITIRLLGKPSGSAKVTQGPPRKAKGVPKRSQTLPEGPKSNLIYNSTTRFSKTLHAAGAVPH